MTLYKYLVSLRANDYTSQSIDVTNASNADA